MKKSQEILVILTPGFAADEGDSTCLPAQQQLVISWQEQFPGIPLIILAFPYGLFHVLKIIRRNAITQAFYFKQKRLPQKRQTF